MIALPFIDEKKWLVSENDEFQLALSCEKRKPAIPTIWHGVIETSRNRIHHVASLTFHSSEKKLPPAPNVFFCNQTRAIYLKELFKKYNTRLQIMIRAWLKAAKDFDPESSDRIMSDIWFALLKHMNAKTEVFETEENFWAWLKKIAYNKYIDLLRDKKKRGRKEKRPCSSKEFQKKFRGSSFEDAPIDAPKIERGLEQSEIIVLLEKITEAVRRHLSKRKVRELELVAEAFRSNHERTKFSDINILDIHRQLLKEGYDAGKSTIYESIKGTFKWIRKSLPYSIKADYL